MVRLKVWGEGFTLIQFSFNSLGFVDVSYDFT